MGDRDAFGREKDENTLEGMGWSTAGSASTPAPVPQPVPRPAPASREELPGMVADVVHEGVPGTHAPAAPTFPDQPRLDAPPRRRAGGPGLGGLSLLFRLVRGLIPLAIIIALVAGAGGALIDTATDKATEAIESATDDLSITTGTPSEPGTAESGAEAGTPESSAPAAPPTGLSRGSLLLRQNFAPAMQKLRTGGYGRLKNLRVAPERIDATLVSKTGRLRTVQIQPGGAVRDLGGTATGFSQAGTMSIAEINPSAPFRLTFAAAGRLKVPASRVNYLVYWGDTFGADARWYVYFKGGQIFTADARGRIGRRIS